MYPRIARGPERVLRMYRAVGPEDVTVQLPRGQCRRSGARACRNRGSRSGTRSSPGTRTPSRRRASTSRATTLCPARRCCPCCVCTRICARGRPSTGCPRSYFRRRPRLKESMSGRRKMRGRRALLGKPSMCMNAAAMTGASRFSISNARPGKLAGGDGRTTGGSHRPPQ